MLVCSTKLSNWATKCVILRQFFSEGAPEGIEPNGTVLNKRLIFRVLENVPLSSRLACILLAIFGNILVDSRFYSLTEGETYE
jgi:hypothetical protein